MESKYVVYSSSDLYFAAYLCALDYTLKATEKKVNPSGGMAKVHFVFELDAVDLARLKVDYFGGAGEVKAKRYVDSLRSLKSMVHT